MYRQYGFALLCLILFSCLNISAQRLNSEDLIQIYSMSLIESTDYLLGKDWHFDEVKKIKDASEAGWSYNDPKSDLIIAYLSVLDPVVESKTVVYTTFSFNIFQEFRKALREYSIVETGVADNSLYSKYDDGKHQFKLEISSDKMISENIYTISLIKSPNYIPNPRD